MRVDPPRGAEGIDEPGAGRGHRVEGMNPWTSMMDTVAVMREERAAIMDTMAMMSEEMRDIREDRRMRETEERGVRREPVPAREMSALTVRFG